MKLKELLPEYVTENGDIEISSISIDSREIGQNCLYFCLSGTSFDGHDFADEAIKHGAVAIVAMRELDVAVTQILVDDTRHAFAVCACNFYKNPAKELKLIGITGTNGKTTTSYIIKSIIESAGKKCGLIGTNCIIIGEKNYPAKLTTPDPMDLNRILREMADDGMEYAVMEVSAHALALKKIDGIIFDVACFTNLTQDHLDFFDGMESYTAAKMSFFTPAYAKKAVINIDDKLGAKMAKEATIPVFTYGCNNPSDAFAIDLKMSVGGIEYVLNLFDDIMEIKFSLSGKFNMYNTLCAATAARLLGISNKSIIKGIKTLTKVEGRFNIINTIKCSVIIDFAHTEDGLHNIIEAVREFAKGKVITVFGCGGNRDRKKRPAMGKIAALLSDYCVITSDNPRYENPMEIINEIEAGIREEGKNNYCKIDDRKAAIRYAIETAQPDDIVIIAGKGAEPYQEIAGHKYPYSDEEFVLQLIGV